MKILAIKLGALGDVIMATAVLRQLCADYRHAEIWLLTVPAFAPLFVGWPQLHVHAVPRHGLRNTWRTLRWIRQQRFDRVYDLQSNDRTRWWCLFSGVPVRIGNHPYFPYTIHPPAPYVGQCHAFARLNDILESAGHQAAPATPFLPPNKHEQTQVREWMRAQDLVERNFVLLHAGASVKHPAKRWPYYAELAAALKSRGLQIVWIGGEDDATLNRALSGAVGIDATGRFTVAELAELGRHARFAVTNDSAPMHILSCSGIPIFGLFGPTDWRRTHALGQGAYIISLDRAATRSQCNSEDQRLDLIPASRVLQRLIEEKVC